jgi:hypothetical protein
MEELLYDGKTRAEKIELLKANCLQKEDSRLKFFFSEDDIDEMKSRLAEESIEREQNEDELRQISKATRTKIKENTRRIKELLVFLKDKFEYRTEEIYHFDDQQEGLMLTYNGDGELIATRKLRPSEKQTRIFDINQKTA